MEGRIKKQFGILMHVIITRGKKMISTCTDWCWYFSTNSMLRQPYWLPVIKKEMELGAYDRSSTQKKFKECSKWVWQH